MTILVTGSREWKDSEFIKRVLSEYVNYDTHRDITLIHGGARGVDTMCDIFARRWGWKVVEMKADWDSHGKAAGAIRNNAMLDLQPDVVLAFWDGRSRGTEQCFNEANRRGLKVVVYEGDKIQN